VQNFGMKVEILSTHNLLCPKCGPPTTLLGGIMETEFGPFFFI